MGGRGLLLIGAVTRAWLWPHGKSGAELVLAGDCRLHGVSVGSAGLVRLACEAFLAIGVDIVG